MTAIATFIYVVRSIICSKMLTFRENRKKLIFGCASLENQFSAIFSKNERFRAYSASYSIYKRGHCGNFAPKIKSLRPSWAKIEFCENAQKRQNFARVSRATWHRSDLGFFSGRTWDLIEQLATGFCLYKILPLLWQNYCRLTVLYGKIQTLVHILLALSVPW